MTLTASMFFIVCPLAFLAGFLDSIAGGGGMITLPAYYLAGLPPALAAGTNKLSASMGTIVATANYARAGKISCRIGIPAVCGALVCGTLGALVLTALPPNIVRILVLCCIPIAAVFTLRKPKQRQRAAFGKRLMLGFSVLLGCVMGFYDGLIGPGTGTFLILLLLQVFQLEAVEASGTAKIINLAGNIAALLSFLFTGNVLIWLGLPAGMFTMLGAHFGSRLTIQKGSKLIRLMMLVVLGLLLIKILADIVFPSAV